MKVYVTIARVRLELEIELDEKLILGYKTIQVPGQ
jgi:hypothetical protein